MAEQLELRTGTVVLADLIVAYAEAHAGMANAATREKWLKAASEHWDAERAIITAAHHITRQREKGGD